MTHQEWLDEIKFKYDKHSHGILQYHWNTLNDKKLLQRYLHEPNTGWLIWELAVRKVE